MLGERRQESTKSGLRWTDRFSVFGKSIALIVTLAGALGFVGKTYLKADQVDKNTVNIQALTQRTTVLEQVKHDDHYMICILFKRVATDAVPASCSDAV